MHNYTPEMVEYLKDSLSEIVHFFGYSSREGHPYSFFDYKGKAKEEHEQMFEEFKKLNVETKEWCRRNKEELSQIKFPINEGKSGIKYVGEKNILALKDMVSRVTIKDN